MGFRTDDTINKMSNDRVEVDARINDGISEINGRVDNRFDGRI